MALTPKQKRFVEEYKKDIGVTPTSNKDREYTAWLISRIKPSLMPTGYIGLLDMGELETLAAVKQAKINKVRLVAQRRRHEKRNDFALTEEEWQDALEYFDYRCAYCGSSNKLTYDHFIPFSKGGSFTKGNIIPACRKCNSSKKDKDFKDWYKGHRKYTKERESQIETYLVSL